MLRIRNEPSRGVDIGAFYYYMVDFDLDGLVDVGCTTRIEALERAPRATIPSVIKFCRRRRKRGEQSRRHSHHDRILHSSRSLLCRVQAKAPFHGRNHLQLFKNKRAYCIRQVASDMSAAWQRRNS
jgi:hypothetical protein